MTRVGFPKRTTLLVAALCGAAMWIASLVAPQASKAVTTCHVHNKVSQNVNVREQPRVTDSAILAKLPPGRSLPCGGGPGNVPGGNYTACGATNAKEWISVRLSDGRKGYVARACVEVRVTEDRR